MAKLNCWEFMKCGRESCDGFFSDENTCPTSAELCTDGINDGINGGRACWALAGTFCGGEVQCIMAAEIKSCLECEFYQIVKEEEGWKFYTGSELTKLILYKEDILRN